MFIRRACITFVENDESRWPVQSISARKQIEGQAIPLVKLQRCDHVPLCIVTVVLSNAAVMNLAEAKVDEVRGQSSVSAYS